MNIDITKIENLLSEKKYDEVRRLIRDASSSPLTEKEKGAALVGLASVYMDVSNAIQERYRDALKEAISSLGQINNAENKFLEKARITEVKAGLNS